MYGEELEDHNPNGIIDYLKSKVPHEGISDVSIPLHSLHDTAVFSKTTKSMIVNLLWSKILKRMPSFRPVSTGSDHPSVSNHRPPMKVTFVSKF